jgi:hypothetical protein
MQRLMQAQPGTPLHLSLQPVVQRTDLEAVRTLDFAGRVEAHGVMGVSDSRYSTCMQENNE